MVRKLGKSRAGEGSQRDVVAPGRAAPFVIPAAIPRSPLEQRTRSHCRLARPIRSSGPRDGPQGALASTKRGRRRPAPMGRGGYNPYDVSDLSASFASRLEQFGG